MPQYDAIVIGSGPNGLSAAITLARKKLSVLVIEADKNPGGGMRTAELTLPGFKHDVCSAIHPMGYSSPFFRTIPLTDLGVEWIFPETAVAHMFNKKKAVLLKKSIEETTSQFGVDETKYKNYISPLVESWDNLAPDLLGPITFPKHPIEALKFGLNAIQSSTGFAKSKFNNLEAQALFLGIAAHAMIPLEKIFTASFAIVLQILAHKVSWPFPKGGSSTIADAMMKYFLSLGGELKTDLEINNIDELPSSTVVLFDLSPRQILKIMGNKLPSGYSSSLKRYRYSAGIFKLDLALSEPVPWKDKHCLSSPTIHIGGSMEEILNSERLMWSNKIAEEPFMLAAQQSIFDNTRAPKGKHTFWAYCHVPHGSVYDMSEKMIKRIEYFAPGFKETIIAKHAINCVQLESYNHNMIGGDIMGGMQDWKQLFTRPVFKLNPYRIPVKGYYICSASSPPGGGVHGMCGFHSANTALSDHFK